MSNPTGIGGFKKGGDPRIWRFGKPKAFTALRELGQAIAHEKAKSKETGQTVVIDRHTATIGEMIMRSWATSRVPILQKAFIEIAFGKVPDEVNVGFNFAKMTDEQLRKFIEGALVAVGAGIDGSATPGLASPAATNDGGLPGVHPER